MPTQEVIDAFIELELKALPRADEHRTRLYEWHIRKGTTFNVRGRRMEFPKDVTTKYVALEPVKGLPIRLWYRNVVQRTQTG